MKPAEVRAQIAAGRTGPLYLLEGDDLQARHELALEFAALVEEGLQAFNVESFYANEASTAAARDQIITAILGAARTLPMMAPRRVVLVHEAERLLSPKRAREDEETAPEPAGSRKRKAAATTPSEELEAYVASPEPMTTLVFVTGPLDANRRLVKLVRKHAVAVDCGSLSTAHDAAAWIRKRLEKDELAIEPRAIAVLLETTGLGLGRIRSEVEKVVLYAAGESTVTERHIRDLVVPENEPGEDFAIGKALWANNPREMLGELSALLDAGIQPVMVLGQIRAAAGRLRPDARVRRAMDLIFETDLALKSSMGEPRHLLERLVVELCGR